MRQLIRKILHETVKDKDESAKFIKCRECKKKFTQTIHKGKKSLPICPHCGAHNTEKKEVDEGITDYIFKKLNKYPFHEYQKVVDNFMNVKKLKAHHDIGILEETHMIDPSGEVVIKVKDSVSKGGNVIYVSWRLMNELEGFIPSRGLVICVAKWVENKLKLDNVVGWEIFLD